MTRKRERNQKGVSIALTLLLVISTVAVIPFTSPNGTVAAANQDFTTYTVDDPNNAIEVTENSIDFSGLPNGGNGAVYKNEGLGYNGGNITFKVNTTGADTGQTAFVGFATEQTTEFESAPSNEDEFVGIRIRQNDYIALENGTAEASPNMANIQQSTTYTVKLDVDRQTGEVTGYVYNADGSTLLGQETIVFANQLRYDYTYGLLANGNDGSGTSISGSVSDMDVTVDSDDTTPAKPDDLTKYTIYDPNNEVTVTEHRIEYSFTESNSGYVRDPQTMQGDHELKFKVNKQSGAGAYFVGFSNAQVDDLTAIKSNPEYKAAGFTVGGQFILRNGSGTGIKYDTIGTASGTYYVTLRFDTQDDQIVGEIYSDMHRTNLLESHTIQDDSGIGYDYLYAWLNHGDTDTQTQTGSIEYLRYGGAEQSASQGGVEGRVVNQNDQPVSNATVTVTGIDRAQIDANPAQIEDRINEIEEQLTNPRPPNFSTDTQLTGGDGLFSEAETKYVAAHAKSDWGLTAYTDSPQLGNPQVQLPANEEIALSVWDPSDDGIVQNAINRDLHGAVDSDTDIVVERIDPTGDAVNRQTYETDTTYDVGLSGFGGQHDLATVTLPAGFYRVYPEGSPETAYPIQVGEKSEVVGAVVEGLENEKGQLTAQAEWVREYKSQNVLKQYTTTTNENGSFSVDLPSSVTRVSVQAHKAPPGLDADPQNTSLQDVREFYAVTDYNGSYVVPAEAGTYSVPANDITVNVVEAEAPQFADLGRYQNATEAFQALLQNLSYSELPSSIQQRLDELDRAQLEETSERLQRLTNQNSELEARVEELTNRDLSEITINDSSDEELRAQIQAQQQAINELRSTIESSDTSAEVAAGVANSSATFMDSLTEEQVRVVAQFPNGTSKEVPMEYITVDQSAASIVGQGGTQVSVENYPVGDVSGVRFAYQVATENGIGKTSTSATDPSADAIGLDAISLSSLRPGPDEQVDVTLVGDDDTQVTNITNVRAVAPDGTELSTSTDGPATATFTTSGEGRHYVEVTFETASGEQATLTHRIAAAGTDQAMPPGIRVKDTVFGTLAVVGDGYEAGSVDVRNGGSTIDVTAQVGADEEAPARTHLYAHGTDLPPTSTLSVNIVRGDQQRSVQRHVEVTAHLPAIRSETPTLYRNGEALPRNGEGKLASVSTSADETTIVTVTDARGSLQLETNSNPGLGERISWYIDRNAPDFSFGIGQVPVVPTVPVPDVSGTISAAPVQAAAPAPTINPPTPGAVAA